MFTDRLDAADRLAAALASHRGRRPLVIAIPRGAVPMGERLAERLGGELDVVLVRKLGAPGQAEVAVGAVDESGWMHVSPHAGWAGADENYLDAERERQLARIRERRARYTPGRSPIDPAGRIVIVVDDGLATGETMIAALHALRERAPARLVCAVPVGAPDSVTRVGALCDELVCLEQPADFTAVSMHYRRFDQVEDEEVIRVLRRARAAKPDDQAPTAG